MKSEAKNTEIKISAVKMGCPDKNTDMPGYLKYMRDKDSKMVRGIFKFYEVPGGRMEFMYRAYKGDEIEKWEVVDGEISTIPLGVAKHLNKNGWVPEHRFLMDERGKNISSIGKKIRRFGFQSLEFCEEDDLQNVSHEEDVVHGSI